MTPTCTQEPSAEGGAVNRFTFRKHERLCSAIAIEQLFSAGASINHYPFRLLYHTQAGDEKQASPVQLAIAVPKRSFKRAVKRNLLKRRIREAYRLNKAALYTAVQQKGIGLNILLVYVSKEVLPYSEIEPKLIKLLGRLADRIEKGTDVPVPPVG